MVDDQPLPGKCIRYGPNGPELLSARGRDLAPLRFELGATQRGEEVFGDEHMPDPVASLRAESSEDREEGTPVDLELRVGCLAVRTCTRAPGEVSTSHAFNVIWVGSPGPRPTTTISGVKPSSCPSADGAGLGSEDARGGPARESLAPPLQARRRRRGGAAPCRAVDRAAADMMILRAAAVRPLFLFRSLFFREE